MRLLPREQDRLLVFLAAELARRRRGRGLRLSQAEAVALICDETMEAARDGLAYGEVVQRGYAVLGPDDVADGVAELVGRIELEALFADGSRLVVLESPVLRDAPPTPRDARDTPPWEGATAALAVTNEGDAPVGLTSHFHLFEANRALRFDRRAAWGMRLALPPGEKVVVEPGATLELQLRPIAGARVVRGHAGLVDGPLDEPGALEAALALARARGYRGA